MARSPNIFTNPLNGNTYEWRINHNEEEAVSKRRNIEHSSPTGDANLGLIRQQGADTPAVLRFAGTILHREQLLHMLQWWSLSRTQTIYFEDFSGEKAEVLITEFSRTRVRTIRNPGDPENAEDHFWRYTIEMEVIRFIDSIEEEAGVKP